MLVRECINSYGRLSLVSKSFMEIGTSFPEPVLVTGSMVDKPSETDTKLS
jgi:hypothetical protein